jgi:uncharacterized membrane protein
MSAPPPSSTASPSVPPLPAAAYVRMTLVLRLGLGISLAILAIGIVAFWAMNPGTTSSAILSHNPILQYLSFPGLGSGLASGSVGAFLTLGLIALVATPIVRVVSGLYYFRRAREQAMTAITAAVLVMLLLGLLLIGPFIR